jgi:hypothetical protein
VNVWLPLNVTDLVIWVDLENMGDLLLITDAVIDPDLVILVVLRNLPVSLQHREMVIPLVGVLVLNRGVVANFRDSVNTPDGLNVGDGVLVLKNRRVGANFRD